jgi:hypothetical protein
MADSESGSWNEGRSVKSEERGPLEGYRGTEPGEESYREVLAELGTEILGG